MVGSRWLPFPGMSLVLWAVWLLLVNRITVDHVLLGALLGWLIPQVTRLFWPTVPRLRRLDRFLAFLALVHWDILVANVTVARLILGPSSKLRPAFVELPLDLDNDFAITVLANTISLTPGTVSADVSEDRKTLLVHVLDVDDEQALIRHIKYRYERPLREVFPC
jgi:multicomponent K+:H+ antiporter subunit E